LNWFLPPITEKSGRFRLCLKSFGPSWLYSPLRRATQAVCFILFLGLFFYVCWPYTAQPEPNGGEWPSHYADDMRAKECVEAEAFLNLDPLVSLSTAIAARAWAPCLAWAAGILLVCLLIPRGFCGYMCPLGTLIDLFDWAVGKRWGALRVEQRGGWVHLKHYLLVACLVSSAFGVLLTGFLAAIPVITRGLLFTLTPVHLGWARGWHQMPPMNAGHYVSLALFAATLGIGFLRPRFWCCYVCPSGAVFSAFNVLRLTERKVEASCIKCGKCAAVCPFDAIKADFTTRAWECTFCQTCGGACPVHAITFVGRWRAVELKPSGEPSTHEISLSRRGFLGATAGGAVAALGVDRLSGTDAFLPIRPPGSVPEREFLQLCIRCGECLKVCPNNALHPVGFRQGLEGLWTPELVANWSGCEPSCNLCTQVCPTAAIRPIPLDEKRVARIGLAVVNQKTCLPCAGKEACDLCVKECKTAGYDAIEVERVHVQVDEQGAPIEGTGFLAPVVLADRCVGCGLCQTRCHGINVVQKKLLRWTAIEVFAGPGKEDRILRGSYLALRQEERRRKEEALKRRPAGKDTYLPDFLR